MNQGHLRQITLGLLLCLLATTIDAATVSVELSPTQPVAFEGTPKTSAVIVVKRAVSDPVGSSLTVNFSLDGTAVVDVDYTLGSSTSIALGSNSQITIPTGQQSISLFINPMTDALAEGQETVVVQLLGGSGYSTGLPNSVQAPIADDDVDVSLLTPLPLAYEDYTTGPGSVLDPDSNRRGVFRVALSPARSFSTYVLTELSPAGVAGAAQLTSDYSVVYKIGGGSIGQGIGYTVQPRSILAGVGTIVVTGGTGGIPIGAKLFFAGSTTEYTSTSAVSGASGNLSITPFLTDPLINGSAVTVTTPTIPTGFLLSSAHSAGTSSLAVDGGSGSIPAGALITINGNTYAAPNGLANTTGTLVISPALIAAVADNDAITVSWPTISGYTTTGGASEPIGATSLRVTGGQGGFAVGDVFRLGTATTPQYRVTSVVGEVIGFTIFTGTGATNGGVPTVLTGNPSVVTHFAAPLSGVGGRQIQVLVPGASTKVEYGIVPTSDVTPEGAESLTMSLLASNDFEIVAPSVGLMTITDDDVVAWLDPTQSRNATEGGSTGSFTVRLSSAFPRNIAIAYQVGGSATPGSDYTTLTQLVTIPAGSVSGTITVVPTDDATVEDPAETVVLTLQPTNDYRVITTVGADANASAQITINDRVGEVAIVPLSLADSTGTESPTDVTTAKFLVTLSDDDDDPVLASDDLTVTYTIAGSATAGSDYQTLSGSVVIPTGASSAVITVTPIDDLLPEAAETVIVTLTPAQGYSISSTNGAATVTLDDDEPVISVVATNATEGGSSGVFTISYLEPALSRDIVVDLSYSGTAAAGDYTATTVDDSPATQVTIPAGATSTTVTIEPVNDLTAEDSETLIATVVAKPAVYTIAASPATMTITDNEPVVSIQRVNDVAEGDSEQTFRVSYAGLSVGRNIVVKLTYPTDTATATTADFTTPPPATVTIPSTGTEVLVTIAAKYDGVSEGTETVTCEIVANGTLYTIDTESATCDITDLVPTLNLEGDMAISEGGTFDVKIFSSFKPLVPFTVTYTVSGTATAGAAAGGTIDYQTLRGTVEISELETVIPVVTFADAAFDPFETVIITLEEVDPPSYLRAGPDPLSTTVQILDSKRGVSEVYSSDPNDTYTEGDVLTIHVVFTTPVVITGKPTLRLETGTSDGVAKFQDLSLDGYEARFTYTVRATDVTANVDYTGVSALALNGGTIVSDEAEVMDLTLPAPGAEGSLAFGYNRPIAGGVDDGKPPPGTVSGSGGGCGLGSGVAGLVALFMLMGLALSIRRTQA